MDALRLDVRYAYRALLRRPGFTALAVLTLAIGIGVNTVAFSAVNALLLKPFDVADGDRSGWLMFDGDPNGHVSIADYLALADGLKTFSHVAAEGRLPVSLHSTGGAQQAWSLLVSGNYFTAVDARAEIGRLFTPEDLAHSDLPVVVSHRFWTQTLGGGASLAGRAVVLNGRTFAVVGVLPDDHQGRGGLYAPDVWLPLERREVLNLPASLRGDERWLTLYGRLADGTSHAQAAAELTSMAAALRPADAAQDKGRHGRFYPVGEGHPDLKPIAGAAWVAMAIVGTVLLIACFNVAALLMARATERQKEIGVRSALGASRSRILRQLLTEGTLLAALAGMTTLILAYWSGSLLATFSLPAPIPQRLRIGLDWNVVWFTAALVLVAGVFPALLPALQATRANLLRSIRRESALGGRPSRSRNAFVIAQVAGSTLFLAAALLFVRSFVNSSAFDPGFETERTAVIDLSPSLYGYDGPRARLLVERIESRLRSVNGVEAAAAADRIPFAVGFPKSLEYAIDGADCATTECRRATVYAVSQGHIAALGVTVRHGRDFTASDMATGGRVVISEQLATQLWPGTPAIGRTLRVGDAGTPVEVIGVVSNIKQQMMKETPAALIYRPMAADEWANGVSIMVRTAGDPHDLLGALHEQVRAADPAIPMTIATVKERMKMPLWPIRTLAGFFLICGSMALVLATVGLFGVLYFTVAQRTREFGIRVALGATSRRVMTVVIREGLMLAIPGVVLGGLAAFVLARFGARMLFGVSSSDPFAFGATAAIEVLVALAAAALPAYRATKADPMVALRAE